MISLCKSSIVLLAAAATAQPQPDALIFVTAISDVAGNVGVYTGGDNVAWLAAGCASGFHDVNLFGSILLLSGRTQIYASSATQGGCGSAVLSPPSSPNLMISHVTTNGTAVFFTEDTTVCVRVVALAGGTDVCLIADGADGVVSGVRRGISVVNGALVYTVRGFNASDPSMPLNGIIQANLDGSNPQILFNYAPNQAWWITDLVVSTITNTFLGAEFRNDSGNPTNNIQESTWPLGNIEPIQTGIQPADEDNTYVSYDDSVQNMAWYTTAETNQLNAINATGRNAVPMLTPFLQIPATNGTVHGVAFRSGGIPFDYCSSPITPCPTRR